MSSHALRLSLVIPVYNEEHHITACLEAVALQTVAPFEVIIVDNNCTDATISLARQFAFVKIVQEPRQGRSWARSAGFNAAKGDIIGRIDADSVLAPNWTVEVVKTFTEDSSLAGTAGLAYTALIPRVNSIKSLFWSRAYYWFVHASFRTITLWGANMAIRASAWDAIKSSVCYNDALVHEDQDISIEMATRGLKLTQNNNLRITTGGQSYNYLPKLLHYYKLERSTLHLHRQKGSLASKKLPRLTLWQVLPGQLFALLPGIFIALSSVALLPLDLLMIYLGKQKTWLD